jgi:hypothetical protein
MFNSRRNHLAEPQQAPMDPILRHHYSNLANNTAVENDDGSWSTVYTTQVDLPNAEGQRIPTLIPTVWDGSILEPDAAVKRALESGIKWPTAPTHPELRKYDIGLHEDMRPMSAQEAQRMLTPPTNSLRGD